MNRLPRWIGIGLVVASAVLIGAVTLTPTEQEWWNPVSEDLVDPDVPNLVLNVILFVPLGIGLSLSGLRAAPAVLCAFAATIGIEALQIEVIAGRDSSIGDAVANTLGAAIGVRVARRWRREAGESTRLAQIQ